MDTDAARATRHAQGWASTSPAATSEPEPASADEQRVAGGPGGPSIRATWRRIVLVYVAMLMVLGSATVALTRFQQNVFEQSMLRAEKEIGALAQLDRALLAAEDPMTAVMYEIPGPDGLEGQWRRFEDTDALVDASLSRLFAVSHTSHLDEAARVQQLWAEIAKEVDASRALWGTGTVAHEVATGQDRFNMLVWAPLREVREVMTDALLEATSDLRAHVEDADQRQELVQPIVAATVATAILLGLWSGRRLSRRVVQPLAALRGAVSQIRDGVLDDPVGLPASASSETVELATAVNEMAAALDRSQDLLRHQAFHDSLTGLANRFLLQDRIEHALARHARSGGLLSVILLDLDDFKSINDSLGHRAGDELIVTVADRLRTCLRETDTLARLGGDEFAILLEDLPNADTSVEVAQRVLDALSPRFSFEGRAFPVSASLGIAFAEAGLTTFDDVIRNADVAMYITKNSAKGRLTVFEPGMHLAVKHRLQLKADLAKAMGTDELRLHYQPIVDLPTGQIVGVEALARWEHPQRGMVPPAEFIPVAEESGLIVPLGLWVLERACREVQEWQRSGDADPDLRLSVNVSGRQLEDPGFVGHVQDIIDRLGFDPRRLVLEITESVLVSQAQESVERLHDIRRLGVQLAIDDFGTGYSSLASLQQLPVDILKIDRSFVAGLEGNDEQANLARAVLGLGQTLELQTVAEGVESVTQADELTRLNCGMAQGYYFARPADATTAGRLLRNHGQPARTPGGGAAGGPAGTPVLTPSGLEA